MAITFHHNRLKTQLSFISVVGYITLISAKLINLSCSWNYFATQVLVGLKHKTMQSRMDTSVRRVISPVALALRLWITGTCCISKSTFKVPAIR